MYNGLKMMMFEYENKMYDIRQEMKNEEQARQEAEVERQHKKHLATCAKNRKKRKAKRNK